MKKHWIRSGIIAAVLIAAVAGLIFSIRIEPADYRDSLRKKVHTAQELIAKARTGNEKGLYAPQTVLLFQQETEKIRTVIADGGMEYDRLKPLDAAYKKTIDAFKKSAIHTALSPEQVAEMKETHRETVKLSGGAFHWTLYGETVGTPAAVNLEVGGGSAYRENIGRLCGGVKFKTVTLYHDGKLPCQAEIAFPYDAPDADMQAYLFDPARGDLGPMIRAQVREKQLSFPVSAGGTYVLYAADPVKELLTDVLRAREPGSASEAPQSSPAPAEPGSSAQGGVSSAAVPQGSGSKVPAVSSGGGKTSSAKPKNTCFIEIRCDTIAGKNIGKLQAPEVRPYIPADGTIVARMEIEIFENETVFDLLKRVTRNKRIQMEFRNDNAYTGGAYIMGIHHLYEFHGGPDSGWMYSVNGWFPNYGCAAYKLKPGDEVLWCYTCDLGKDVGDYWHE